MSLFKLTVEKEKLYVSLKGAVPLHKEKFFQYLQKTDYPFIIALNPEIVCSKVQVLSATKLSYRAYKRKISRIRKFPILFLLFLAGTNQIKDAINVAAYDPKKHDKCNLVIISDNLKSIKEVIRNLHNYTNLTNVYYTSCSKVLQKIAPGKASEERNSKALKEILTHMAFVNILLVS